MRWRRRASIRGRIAAVAAAVWAAGRAASADEITPGVGSESGSGDASSVGVELSDAAKNGLGMSLLLVQPTVNAVQRDVTMLLRDAAGRYYVDAATLADWRIPPPYPSAIEQDGREFYALDDFPGVSVTVAERTMAATVNVPPELMPGTRRSFANDTGYVSPDGAFGTFLDYDVAYTDDDSGLSKGLSGLLSPTVFTRRGSLSATALYQGYAGFTGTGAPAEPEHWIRLDTAFTRDNPEKMTTLRVGDSITPYGSWARSVRFGGIQFGTNFATRPYEITFPLPSIKGTAAVPSAVDILVNGARQSRTEVPSGAFQMDDIPVVTGSGQIQVVTRDLLGREQVVVQDFYVSERLLRRGLNEYSLNAGALREDFGYASNAYGELLISGMLRHGLSDVLTIEGRIDATSEVKVAGASLARAMGHYGVTSAALAVSDGNDSGTLIQVGHEFQGRVYRASLRVQSSRDFEQPGTVVFPGSGGLFERPELQVVASGGRSFGKKGSLGVTYVDEQFADRAADRQVFTLSYSRTITRLLMFSARASYFGGLDSSGGVNVIVSRVLGRRSSVSSSLSSAHDTTTMRVDHRYQLPVGPGFGYRTSVVGGDRRAVEAQVAMNTENAYYDAEVAQREGARGWRVQTRGSFAALGGAVFAAREIRDGFAVVDAAGFEGVRVYLENREIGTTNANGRLLVPSLQPYESNQLRIETTDLPLAARVDTDALRIAPYYRSGAIASFRIEASASATLRAVLPDGSPVPEGARARVDDHPDSAPVGMNGRLYLENLRSRATVEITYGAKRCTLTIPVVRMVAESVPDLGAIACRPAPPEKPAP